MDNNLSLLDNLPNDIAMNTNVWGPPIWFFLHSMAMAYPKKIHENDEYDLKIKQNMHNFLNSLGYVLPCPICGESYSKFIQEPEFNIMKHLNSRADLIKFIYKIHNKVNDKLGVLPCNTPKLEEVIKFYSKFIAGNPCSATTDEERKMKKKIGCKDMDFKKYKCFINIVDTYNKKNEVPLKEHFSYNYSSFSLKDIIYLLIIICLIFLLFIKFYNCKTQ
jgi:hypothetical protein